MNILAVLVAALIPLLVGFIWYNPKVFGNAWMLSIGVSNPDDMKQGANMTVIFGLSLVFAFMLSLSLGPMVVHQFSVDALLADIQDIKNAKVEIVVNGEVIDYINSYRTFKHGALMGAIYGILLCIPIIGTNALFERRGFKYIAINAGYWIVSMILMGGLISAWK